MNIHFFKFASLLYLLGTLAYLVYTIFLKEALSKISVNHCLRRFRLPYLGPLDQVCGSGLHPCNQSP